MRRRRRNIRLQPVFLCTAMCGYTGSSEGCHENKKRILGVDRLGIGWNGGCAGCDSERSRARGHTKAGRKATRILNPKNPPTLKLSAHTGRNRENRADGIKQERSITGDKK